MIDKNDLNEFQEKVFSEYNLIKGFKKSTDQLKNECEQKNNGCLSVPVVMFADFVINWAVKGEKRRRDFEGNEREAKELLREKEIFDRICEMIAKISRREILTEEKFVYELTAEFYRSDLANRFVIPENPVLYAMMAVEIFNAGLENFCNARRNDV